MIIDKNIAILGSGPAGISAAICTARFMCPTTVFCGEQHGGQIVEAIDVDNFIGIRGKISGQDVFTVLYDQAVDFGVNFVEDKVLKIKKRDDKFTLQLNSGSDFVADAVIIATGKSKNTLSVNNLQHFLGRGVSYCVSCDGMFFKNKIVGVVGSGDSAVSGAIFLASIAKQVFIFVRGEKLKASNRNIEQLQQKKNISVYFSTNIIDIHGAGHVESVIVNVKNKKEEIKIDGVFVLTGSTPETLMFEDIIQLDDKGYIITDMYCNTSLPGVFAAGDVQANTYKQVPIAIGNGYTAGMRAFEYLFNDKQ